MTSRERYLAALQHRNTDKVPFSWGLGINAPVKSALSQRLGLNAEQFERWMADITDELMLEPEFIGPKERNLDIAGRTTDVWGVERTPVSYGAGFYDEISLYPLADAKTSSDLDMHVWPSPDWFDFSKLRSVVKGSTDNPKAILASNGNIFERAWYMRGFERMFIDLMDNEEFVWDLLDRVTNYFIAFFSRLLESANGQVDVVFTADDLGGQNGPLVSPKLWERMIMPHHKRLDALIHSYGAKVMYHSDGAVMPFLDGLADMGIDILEALQFDADGMDPVAMKARTGERLCYRGGISVQSTLPFGSVEDVRKEVRARTAVLGSGGGYILAPSHAIQANTPVDNVLAMLEECGRI